MTYLTHLLTLTWCQISTLTFRDSNQRPLQFCPLLMWFDACLLLQKHPHSAAEGFQAWVAERSPFLARRRIPDSWHRATTGLRASCDWWRRPAKLSPETDTELPPYLWLQDRLQDRLRVFTHPWSLPPKGQTLAGTSLPRSLWPRLWRGNVGV